MKNQGNPTAVTIDKLGQIRAQISELKKLDEALSKELKSSMTMGSVVLGEAYRAELSESMRRVLDQEQIRKKIGQKKFLEIAKITVGEAEKIMGKEEIDAATSGYEPIVTLSIKPIK